MRVASFGITENGKSADVSVVPLGGMAGGDFANVNRWRGQVGLPPLADDEIAKLAQKITVPGSRRICMILPAAHNGFSA